MLQQIEATRFVVPLREGGSLPGVVEGSDLGTWVVKFRGAGQGLKVLVAEVVVGELARALGLRVPELELVELPEAIAKYEADEEVQDLLTASVGLNLGVDLLPGAFAYDGSIPPPADEAATILWLDAF
ncbi:HipA domain-containing protein, partial [Escherichia coli]|nr:HipA domain-containing protein [Escherichia coli]